ncbi:hypothetical protein FRC01_009165 [Tulasnella sp. 417]|nr:hypothetical protein FRC01_009165 [Tulasnella sp. 417]
MLQHVSMAAHLFDDIRPQALDLPLDPGLQEQAKTIGFIAYDKDSAAFKLVQDPAEAQVFSVPRHKKKAVIHIKMNGLSTEDPYPYVGLALKNPNDASVETQHTVPPPLPVNLYGNLDYMKPSSLCCRDPDRDWVKANRPLATWALKPCTESSPLPRQRRSAKTSNLQERASAAVWKHDHRSNKLSITWMMDNDKEGELRAIVPNNFPSLLHFHRVQDWNKARSRLKEREAELYFVPDDSIQTYSIQMDRITPAPAPAPARYDWIAPPAGNDRSAPAGNSYDEKRAK